MHVVQAIYSPNNIRDVIEVIVVKVRQVICMSFRFYRLYRFWFWLNNRLRLIRLAVNVKNLESMNPWSLEGCRDSCDLYD